MSLACWITLCPWFPGELQPTKGRLGLSFRVQGPKSSADAASGDHLQCKLPPTFRKTQLVTGACCLFWKDSISTKQRKKRSTFKITKRNTICAEILDVFLKAEAFPSLLIYSCIPRSFLRNTKNAFSCDIITFVGFVYAQGQNQIAFGNLIKYQDDHEVI